MFQRLLFTVTIAACFALSRGFELNAQQPVGIEILTTFDYPGAGNSTSPLAINELGDIAGSFDNTHGYTIGFVRFHSGNFSPQLLGTDGSGQFTQARGINISRTVSGYYRSQGAFHGFFLSRNRWTTYDVEGKIDTAVAGINDAGDFVGEFAEDGGPWMAYYSIDGILTPIVIPGATTSSSYAINANNEIVGYYADAVSYARGFYQDAVGVVTYPIDAPEAAVTFLFGISNRSLIVGRFVDSAGVNHGLILKLPNRFVTYDYPDALFTSLNGINSNGFVCGRYLDSAGLYHGFVGRVR